MRWVWISGVAALSLLVGLGAYLAPLHPSLVVLQLAFSRAAFEAVTAQWGAAGVALFRSHLVPDLGLMLAYALWGVCMVRYTRLFRMRHVPQLLAYLPMPLAALADAGENTLHLAITAEHAQPQDWWYPAAGTCASIKLGLIVLFLCAALWRAARAKRCAGA